MFSNIKGKKIALFASGGIDSTILLYLLLKENIPFTVLCINKNNNEKYLRPIISLLEKKFNTSIKVKYNVANDFENKEHLLDTRLKDGIDYKNAVELLKGSVAAAKEDALKKFDVVIMGTTSNPPVKVGGLEPWRPRKTTAENLLLPLLSYNKADVLRMYIKYNCEYLLDFTYSCTENDESPCLNCFACKERAWGFKESRFQKIDIQFLYKIIFPFINASYSTHSISLDKVRDALSEGQLLSKIKCLELLPDISKFNSIALLGGWHGLLAKMLFEYSTSNFNIHTKITNIDLNEKALSMSQAIIHNEGYNVVCADATQYDLSQFDLIINTSSEHMPDTWFDNIAKGSHVLVQSTDFKHLEHINSVYDLDTLSKKFKMTKILYQSEDNFNVYKRFTIYGEK